MTPQRRHAGHSAVVGMVRSMLTSASSQPAQAHALDYGQSTARLTRPRRTELTVDVLDLRHFLPATPRTPRSQALPGNAMPAGSACIPSNALPGAGGGASPAVRSQAEPGNEVGHHSTRALTLRPREY